MSAQRNSSGTPAAMRNIFGIIMIIIYILFPSWGWMRWVAGGLFTAYGLWRAYRQFKGIEPGYGNDRDMIE